MSSCCYWNSPSFTPVHCTSTEALAFTREALPGGEYLFYRGCCPLIHPFMSATPILFVMTYFIFIFTFVSLR